MVNAKMRKLLFCCFSKKKLQERRVLTANEGTPARTTSAPPPTTVGQRLGGTEGARISQDDAKEKALAAAEARQKENENRGLGSESKAKELKEKHEKEELVGKIKAWYELKKEEAPMGLGLASVEQLRATYQRLSSSQ